MKDLRLIGGMIALVCSVFVFTACDDDEVPLIEPEVSTAAISDIAYNTASGGGAVVIVGGDPITARGLCWNTEPAPTVDNEKTTETTDAFTSELTDLKANTTYYVRAYATNKNGTYYGNEQTFKTASLAGTTWDFTIVYNETMSWHADVIFHEDGTTTYDEPDAPGLYTTYGTWSMTDNELTYDMDDNGDNIYVFVGSLDNNEMAGTYEFGGSTRTWSAMKKD